MCGVRSDAEPTERMTTAFAPYSAARLGFTISESVLADTTRWLLHPETWDNNRGNPGFSDTSTFTAAFHRLTGQTPTSYRRNLD